MSASRHRLHISLSPRELARSWLVEHYRRQGWPPVRTGIALTVFVMGIVVVARGSLLGWAVLAWGSFLVFRPIAYAALILVRRARSKPFYVTVDASGVNVEGAKGSKLFPWSEITASGLGSDYLWYEIRRGARATIPFRVMSDRAGIEALFREHGHFRS